MTDTTVAAPAAPVSNEVPINPNPVSQPRPIGNQAPDAPVDTNNFKGSPHRPESRREAIQRAYERAMNPPPKGQPQAEKPAPKAAEAKPGHNRPPEPTEKEKPKPIDLRRPPPKEDREPQPRDRGRFAPREPAIASEPPAQATPGQATEQPPPPQQQRPPGANFVEPPARMAEHAKRDWGKTPESVRGEVHRMHQEYAKAFTTYKADAEAMQPIRHFHQMAQQHGTTLEKALTNYVSMEHKLRADPIAGLDLIVNNLGLKTPDGQRIGLRDIAYHVLTQSPEQLRATQLGNNQQATAHQIGALHQQVAGLQDAIQRMHHQQQFVDTRGAVDQFAVGHPRFDELGDLIEQELKLGFDLETAYRRAELLRPTAHAAQTRNPSAQTRQPDRSISGSPDVAPSNGASRRPREASPTPRDAVLNAIRRVNGI